MEQDKDSNNNAQNVLSENISFDPSAEAITSASLDNSDSAKPISQSDTSLSNKIFGNRPSRTSHFGRSFAAQQTNDNTAQNIASNPNTPQFFSDAAMASAPVPQEPQRRNHIPLFIGISTVALIAIIAVLAVVLGRAGGILTDENQTKLELANAVAENYKSYSTYEDRIRELSKTNFHLDVFYLSSSEEYAKYTEGRDKNSESIKNLRATLDDSKYSSIEGIDEAKELFDKKIVVYEKLDKITTSLVEATRSTDADSVEKELNQYKDLIGMSQIKAAITSSISARQTANKIIKDNDCTESSTDTICRNAFLMNAQALQAYKAGGTINATIKEYINDIDGSNLTEFLKELNSYAATESEKIDE